MGRAGRFLAICVAGMVLVELGLMALPELMLRARGSSFGDGQRHVRFIGDSVTFGYGVPAADSFPALIADANPDLQVENLARPGMRFDNGLEALERGLAESGGGVTVLMLGHNDITSFGAGEVRGGGLRLMRVGRWLLSVLQGAEIEGAEVPELWLADQLERARSLTRAHDSALLVSTYVVGPSCKDEVRDGQERLNAYLRTHARRLGIPLVDLERALPSSTELVFDNIHYTEEGHRQVADEVAAALAREGLIEGVQVARHTGPEEIRYELVVGEPHPDRDYQTGLASNLGWLARARARLALARGDEAAAVSILEQAVAALTPLTLPTPDEPELDMSWDVSFAGRPLPVVPIAERQVQFVPRQAGRYQLKLRVSLMGKEALMQQDLMVGTAPRRGPGRGLRPRRIRQLLQASLVLPDKPVVGEPVVLDASRSTASASTQLLQLEVDALQRDHGLLVGALDVVEEPVLMLRQALTTVGSQRPGPRFFAQALAPDPSLEQPQDFFTTSQWQLNTRDASLQLADLWVDTGAWGPWEPGERRLALEAGADLFSPAPRHCADVPRGPAALGTCISRLREERAVSVALDLAPQRDTLAAVAALGLRRPTERLGCSEDADEEGERWASAYASGGPAALIEAATAWSAVLDQAPESCRDGARLQAWHELLRVLASQGHVVEALAVLDAPPEGTLRPNPGVATHALRGRILALEGQVEEAEHELALAWKRALQGLAPEPDPDHVLLE